MFQNGGGAVARRQLDSGRHGFDDGFGMKGFISLVTRESGTDHFRTKKRKKLRGQDGGPVARQEMDPYGQRAAQGVEDAVGIRQREGAGHAQVCHGGIAA